METGESLSIFYLPSNAVMSTVACTTRPPGPRTCLMPFCCCLQEQQWAILRSCSDGDLTIRCCCHQAEDSIYATAPNDHCMLLGFAVLRAHAEQVVPCMCKSVAFSGRNSILDTTLADPYCDKY